MKKKQISLILAVLVLGLSGCSSKETSEPVQETIEIESSSEIESSEEESSVIEEPTESTEPESESEEETIEVETTEEIESVEETTEVITEESSNDGVSESEPVQTVESVAEPVEIQSQAADTQPQTPSQPSGTISVYSSKDGMDLILTPNGKGWYTDQYGIARDAQGNDVNPQTGQPMTQSHINPPSLPDGWGIDTNNTSTGLKVY